MVEPRIPILCSIRPTENPGSSACTMKAEMPAWPFDVSVLANTQYVWATPALVMKRFCPSRT